MVSIAVEFCAFTLAIAVECRPSTVDDKRFQWSAEQLSLEIGASRWGKDVNFSISPAALHQGFFLFKKGLGDLSHELIAMGGKKNEIQIESFMGIPERSKGLNIIFSWSKASEANLDETLSNIRSTANRLLKASGYEESNYRSLGEVCGFLWQQKIIEDSKPLITPINKRRKSADQLGEKMLSQYGKQINEYITENICMNDEDSSEVYLAAAWKESGRVLLIYSLLQKIYSQAT